MEDTDLALKVCNDYGVSLRATLDDGVVKWVAGRWDKY